MRNKETICGEMVQLGLEGSYTFTVGSGIYKKGIALCMILPDSCQRQRALDKAISSNHGRRYGRPLISRFLILFTSGL